MQEDLSAQYGWSTQVSCSIHTQIITGNDDNGSDNNNGAIVDNNYV